MLGRHELESNISSCDCSLHNLECRQAHTTVHTERYLCSTQEASRNYCCSRHTELSDGRAVGVTHQEAKLCQAETWGLVDVIREPPWRGHDNVSQAAVTCHSERTNSPSVSVSLHNKACSRDLKKQTLRFSHHSIN